VQHQLTAVRAELAGVESLHQQASDNLGRQLQLRMDSSRHQAGLLYLAQLQASMKKLQAQADALDTARAQLLPLCRAAETRLEGLRSHESDAIDSYAREQSYLQATEADRDWVMREAFNKASPNIPAEPGGGA
jgi:chromosome segregation ATPase